MSPGLSVLKGHGTENDFIVVPDLDGTVSLSASLVRALCDRHSGLGADGVIRVLRTECSTEPEVSSQASAAPYFMDYRNADGSIAEMCGNGVRVFARYLQHAGIVDGAFAVATRGGTRSVSFAGADVTVDMGQPVLLGEHPTVQCGPVGPYPAVSVDLPNPHVVVEIGSEAELLALDLAHAPLVTPARPDGQNVEFFVRTGPNRIRMRVHERGVGETRSCGTGICAAVVAAAGGGLRTPWQVDVPGGRCSVAVNADGSILLSGPAVLVATVQVGESWLTEHR